MSIRSRTPAGALAALAFVLLPGAFPSAGALEPGRPALSSFLAGRSFLLLQEDGEGDRGDEPWPADSGSRSLTEPSRGELEKPSGPPSLPKRMTAGLFPLSIAIPIQGSAGAGDDAPSYAGAFGAGIGAGVAGGYRILPSLDARVDLGGTRFGPRSFDVNTPAGVRTNEFTSYTVFWLSVGPRFYVLPDRPAQRWFDPEPKKVYEGFFPFGGFRVGLLFTGAVDWPTPAPAWNYWKAGVGLFFEVYGGVEYRLTESLGAFVEAGVPVLGSPNPASFPPAQSGMNEAGSLTALRFSLGVFIAF